MLMVSNLKELQRHHSEFEDEPSRLSSVPFSRQQRETQLHHFAVATEVTHSNYSNIV